MYSPSSPRSRPPKVYLPLFWGEDCTDDDGDALVWGCMDPLADNYASNAERADGSCYKLDAGPTVVPGTVTATLTLAGEIAAVAGGESTEERVVFEAAFATDVGALLGVASIARGASVIKFPSPLNVLKDTYDHSCH